MYYCNAVRQCWVCKILHLPGTKIFCMSTSNIVTKFPFRSTEVKALRNVSQKTEREKDVG